MDRQVAEELALFTEAVLLWNEKRFFAAHAALEELWRRKKKKENFKAAAFYQALLHAAVALNHRAQKRLKGAEGQLRKAREKAAFADRIPPGYATWEVFFRKLEEGDIALTLPKKNFFRGENEPFAVGRL